MLKVQGRAAEGNEQMTPETGQTGITQGSKLVEIECISLSEVAGDLHQAKLFAETPVEELFGVDQVDRIKAREGAVLVQPGDPKPCYWLVLSGHVRADRPEPDGSVTTAGTAAPGEGFGEVPLLLGKSKAVFKIVATDMQVKAEPFLLKSLDEQLEGKTAGQ